MSFSIFMSQALGSAPSKEAARVVLDAIEATVSGPTDDIVKEALLESTKGSLEPLREVLQERKMLRSDEVWETALQAAFLNKNEAWVKQFTAQSHLARILEGPVGMQILNRLLAQGGGPTVKNATIDLFVSSIAWPLSSLNDMLERTLKAYPSGEKLPVKLLVSLLEKGANPCAATKDPTVPMSLSWIVKVLNHLPLGGRTDLIEGLLASPWKDEVINARVNKKSFPSILLDVQFNPGRLATLLDQTGTRWWDNDPFSLMPAIMRSIHRLVRQQDFGYSILPHMVKRIEQHGLEEGLDATSLIYSFQSMANSVATAKSCMADKRTQYWQREGILLGHLWKQPNPWEKMVNALIDFEQRVGDKADPSERQALMDSFSLYIKTPEVEPKPPRPRF